MAIKYLPKKDSKKYLISSSEVIIFLFVILILRRDSEQTIKYKIQNKLITISKQLFQKYKCIICFNYRNQDVFSM